MADMDALFKLMLLGSMAEAAKQACKGCATEKENPPLKFSSESEALAYAKRIVAIRPGDTVNLYDADENELHLGVFTGAHDYRGAPVFVTTRDDNALQTTIASWNRVILID